MKHIVLFPLLICLPLWMFAQTDSADFGSISKKLERVSFSGYGAMNYYNFNWQTDSIKRNAIDNERFILDFAYRWTDRIKLNTELEFEHGGTGVSVEFDRFEEFGEFEYEVSKGGEVLIEQMNVEFGLKRDIQFQIGRVKMPFAMMFEKDEPTDYLTAVISETEIQILPENWTENGLLLYGKFGKKRNWQWHLSLVNGLDNSNFNSNNWIKRGNQRRFEMVNAENFALCGRLDYRKSKVFLIGISAYGSNSSSANRPKPDLKIQTPIGMSELHVQYNQEPFQLSAMAFYGELGNSEALSNQNRNLSNNLNVKRTPVGAAAIGGFFEAGLSIFGEKGLLLTEMKRDFLLFGRFDYYDTQFKTQGLIFNNPRWERQSWTVGMVCKWIDEVHFKAQYSDRVVGAPAPTSVQGGRHERTFIAGFAFEF
ncbi:MAG: autotransporter outer membrane beta-barrel domain-containing protein [Saprospiraceae bacterium]|nr:autotransporter outer membrane beta-barrel domain-containing protein [Saprospiraceae bacterium]